MQDLEDLQEKVAPLAPQNVNLDLQGLQDLEDLQDKVAALDQ